MSPDRTYPRTYDRTYVSQDLVIAYNILPSTIPSEEAFGSVSITGGASISAAGKGSASQPVLTAAAETVRAWASGHIAPRRESLTGGELLLIGFLTTRVAAELEKAGMSTDEATFAGMTLIVLLYGLLRRRPEGLL